MHNDDRYFVWTLFYYTFLQISFINCECEFVEGSREEEKNETLLNKRTLPSNRDAGRDDKKKFWKQLGFLNEFDTKIERQRDYFRVLYKTRSITSSIDEFSLID